MEDRHCLFPNLLVLVGYIGSTCTLDLGNESGRNPIDKLIEIKVESIDEINLLLAIFRREIFKNPEHLLIISLSKVSDGD